MVAQWFCNQRNDSQYLNSNGLQDFSCLGHIWIDYVEVGRHLNVGLRNVRVINGSRLFQTIRHQSLWTPHEIGVTS